MRVRAYIYALYEAVLQVFVYCFVKFLLVCARERARAAASGEGINVFIRPRASYLLLLLLLFFFFLGIRDYG